MPFQFGTKSIHNSISFMGGFLPASHDQYLDGSGRVFQKGTWHLGNATRTWGETCGIKIGRGYVGLQVTHVNPNQTPEAANE